MAKALPGWLIKYLEPQYVEGALTEGKFRIGTLHEYQDQERYQGPQLDRGEGTMMRNGVIGRWSRDDGHPTIPMIEQMFGGMPSVIESCIFEQCLGHSPDYFIFCSSHTFNPDVYSRYGAAVRITDVRGFWDAITLELVRSGRVPERFQRIAGKIKYREREVRSSYHEGRLETTDDAPWIFVKPESYMEDHEYRFAWPILSLEKDRVITCPEAARYCELFEPMARRRWPKTSRLRARRGMRQQRRSKEAATRPSRSQTA